MWLGTVRMERKERGGGEKPGVLLLMDTVRRSGLSLRGLGQRMCLTLSPRYTFS